MSDLNARIVLSVDGAQESGKSIGQVADAVQHLGRELGGELFRWFDLKRTNKLVDYVRAHNTDAKANIQDYHILRPIPQSQLDVITNPGDFRQNPGWQ